MKEFRLWVRFLTKGIPVNELNILLFGLGFLTLTIVGAVLFSRKNMHKAGQMAAKIVLGFVVTYQVIYACTQHYDVGIPATTIIPWNPSTISYYLLPTVAILNIKPLKDISYTLAFLAGAVMTFSEFAFPSMWVDFYQNSLVEYPFMMDMIANARVITWTSVLLHGGLLVGSVWLIASGDFEYRPENCKFFVGGLAILVVYGIIWHHYFVPNENVFFLFENELPFEITHIDFRLDYLVILSVLLWCIYYLLPHLKRNLPKKRAQKLLIESHYGK